MSEVERLAAVSPEDDATRLRRVSQFHASVLWLVLGFTPVRFLLGYVFGDPAPALMGAITAAYGAALLWARWQMRQGRLEDAVFTMALGFAGIGLPYVFVLRELFSVVVTFPFVVVAIALPYVRGRRLSLLIALSSVVSVGGMVLGQFFERPNALPAWFVRVEVTASVVACTFLILLLLVQFSDRLNEHLSALFAKNGELSAARAEIARQNEQLEALLRSLQDAVVACDGDGKVTFVNRATEELSGKDAGQARGMAIGDLLSMETDGAEPCGAVIARVLASGVGAEIDARMRSPTRGERAIEAQVSPVALSGGAVSGAVVVLRDVTLRRQAEQLRQEKDAAEAAAQAQGTFLANMSHEIRTPMNAVIGMAGLLEGTALSGQQRELALGIKTSGEHLLTVINDILDFSKLDAGALELESHDFDLVSCAEEAVELVSAGAARSGLELYVDISPDVPAWVCGDAGRLRQVLVNLLGNAVKFTRQGEVSLTVRAEALVGSRFVVRFAVRDTGVGIPRERFSRLFQRFSQVDESTTRQFGGTGLGLAICKRLVGLMGGDITVESEPGKGSTFTVTLSMQQAEGPFVDDGAARVLEGKRALVVDDHASNRRVLRLQLESLGMVVVDEGDPRKAISLVAGGASFDVLVVDHQMPEIDGVMLVEALAERVPEMPRVVMLTSLGMSVPRAAAARFSAVLYKPARRSRLREVLVGCFSGRPDRSSDRPGASSHSALRVLLVEDNEMNQRVALLLLERLGIKADVASDGKAAVEAVSPGRYDLVLMDVQMPVMDGLEATRRICARIPTAERPRIVAMTAHALKGDRERCLEAGMDDYLTKPLRPEALTSLLARVGRGEGEQAAVEGAPVGGARAEGGVDEAVLSALLESVGGDRGLVRDLVDTFVGAAPSLVEQIERGVASGELAEATDGAHTLKPNAEMLGATELHRLCVALEAACGKGVGEARPLASAVSAEFSLVKAKLTSIMASWAPRS